MTRQGRNSDSPLLIITSIASSNISDVGATITWNTNRPADSRVEYGLTTSYGNVVSLATLDVSHRINLFGLTQNRLYHYRVKSMDGSGNLSTSGDLTLTTQSGGPRLPAIDLFTAAPASITSGQSSFLSWSVKDATSLRLDPGGINVTGSTSRSVAPTTTTIYTLTATNSVGSVTRNVTVTVGGVPPPILPSIDSFAAAPASITSGQSSLLSWSVKDATSLRLDPGAINVTGSTSRSVTLTTTTIYTLTAINNAGSVTRNVQVTVTNVPPPTSGAADPTLLPLAAGQSIPSTTPAVAGGGSYLDPVSGVRVWRATSENYPCAGNTGLRYHDYGDTNQISHEWGDGYQTILIRTCGEYYLVDFKRGVGFTNWRKFAPGAQPDSDLSFIFSSNPATPRIAYIINNGSLIRYNTGANQVENTGNFPKTAWGARAWLQSDINDIWFVANGASQTSCMAWNSQTNVSQEKTTPNYDECHLENRGRYVELITGGRGVVAWDLQNDTVKPFDPPTGRTFHMASSSGYFTSVDVDTGGGRTPYYRMDPATGAGILIYDNAQFGYDWSAFHHSGNWVNQEAPDERQWFLISTYGANTSGAFLKHAIGFMRLDGSDIRFLAHTYNEIVDYFKLPRAMISPNGKLVVFDSEFRGAGGGDVYVVEVPLR